MLEPKEMHAMYIDIVDDDILIMQTDHNQYINVFPTSTCFQRTV